MLAKSSSLHLKERLEYIYVGLFHGSLQALESDGTGMMEHLCLTTLSSKEESYSITKRSCAESMRKKTS
jgi:hypothetical protein